MYVVYRSVLSVSATCVLFPILGTNITNPGSPQFLVSAGIELAGQEEVERVTSVQEKRLKLLETLGRTLGLERTPRRIEAYDISNTGNFGIVSSMTVFEDGRPARRKYRKFRMKTVEAQDDFASMRETIARRVQRFLDGDEGFAPLPDVFFIDGGAGQVAAAEDALLEKGFPAVPVYGMVKDDRHRTRALTDRAGREIGIQGNPAVFALVGNIQEETHRFAIEYHKKLRQKTITSALESIPGVGEKRRKALMDSFRSVKRIQAATVEELSTVVPKTTAQAVYDHFHSGESDPDRDAPGGEEEA